MKVKNVYTPSVVPANLWTADVYGSNENFASLAE